MSGSRPIEMLEAEHRVILKIVGVLGVLADALDAGKPVQPQTRAIWSNSCALLPTNAITARRRRTCFPPWQAGVFLLKVAPSAD